MCGKKRHTKTGIRSKMSELICGRIAAGENYNLTRDRNTPEEAFADYKKHKEAYIIMMADKYMDYLPVEIYDALIDYEVEPF